MASLIAHGLRFELDKNVDPTNLRDNIRAKMAAGAPDAVEGIPLANKETLYLNCALLTYVIVVEQQDAPARTVTNFSTTPTI
jgi:hypothetical protein